MAPFQRFRNQQPLQYRRLRAAFSFPPIFARQLVQLPVNEKATEDSGRTPGDSVGPALDTQLLFDKDKNVAQTNKVVSLSAVRTTVNIGKFLG